jgi:hypothetical protein
MTDLPAPSDALPADLPGGPDRLRLGAYLLLGDPAYLEQSFHSLYGIADRIVVVFDEEGLSWTKRPLPIEHCLSVVTRADTGAKVTLLPGNFHDTGLVPLEAETVERNAGVAALGGTVDWVVQIDTDEVLGNPARFVASIARAEAAGRSAVDYPARWLYGHVSGRTYLERCRRTWGISAGYPGPVAVRAGTTLRLARQCDVPIWRADFRQRNTDPFHPADVPIDETVDPEEAIWHFSWVRSEAEMRAKSTSSGHVDDLDWGREIDRWLARCRHPHLTTLLTPFRRSPTISGAPTWLRSVRVPAPVLAGAG